MHDTQSPAYDVLIVGSRVSGASLALLMAQRGYRVMMIDRDEFPSDTLSTHYLHTSSVNWVQKLGVLDDIEAAGFRRITRSRTWIEDCLLEGPIGPEGAYGLTPRRNVFDSVLVDHATRAGATFSPRTRVESLIEEDGRVVGAVIVPRGGSPIPVRARVVVGADGRNSKVADWVGARIYNDTPGLRPAFWGYFHGLEPLPEPAVELFFQDDRVGFIFPMQPGVDCMALEMQPDDFDTFRKNAGELFEQYFASLPTMAARMRNLTLENRMLGMQAINNFFRVPYGPGWALTGDAACCKDPITGTGMVDAVIQAFGLADALSDVFEGAGWDTRMAAYQQQRDESLSGAFAFTIWFAQMRDMPVESLAWLRGALSNPGSARVLAHSLPAALPDIAPEHTRPMYSYMAQAFGAPAAGD